MALAAVPLGAPAPGRNLSMRQLLAGLFAGVALVVVVASVVAAIAFSNLAGNRRQVIERIDPADVLVGQLLTAYVDQETGVRGYVLTGERQFLEPYNLGESAAATAMASLDRLLPGDSRATSQLTAVEDQARLWLGDFAQPAILATNLSDPRYAAPAAQANGKALFDTLRKHFTQLEDELVSERTLAVSSLGTASDELAAVLIAAAVVLVVSGGLVWRTLDRRVIRPLDSVGSDARVVTSGELDHAVRPVGPREVVALATDINAMRQRILEEVQTVQAGQERLATLNRDLARSNEELEQFAYVASHDLQEPLRKVTSFCQLLAERYAGQLDQQADEYIAFAVDGSKRMQVLINDLLAFARIGRTTDALGPVPLQECVDAAVRNLSLTIDEAGATVSSDDGLPTIRGDRSLITLLMQTLIHNGIKFHSEARPEVRISSSRERSEWIVAVTDNGIGVEPRYAERIFVLFQRLHGRSVYGGTGIGLALAKKVVEFHGGRIWLDTEHTPGARICFSVPADQTEATP